MVSDARLVPIALAAALTVSAPPSVATPVSAAAPLASSLASPAPRDVTIDRALKLDARRLLSMKAGEQVAIDFPAIGRHMVTFESVTQGLDGRRYWHGRLGANPRDRVFLKQTASGFIGAVRFAGRQVAFAQRGDGAMQPTNGAALAASSGRAYVLGASLGRGTVAVQSNLAALAQAQPGSEFAFPLPGGQTEVAIVTRAGVDEHGFQQVVGVSRMNGPGYPVILTVSPEAVFGSVITPQGDFQVLTRAGRTQILDPRAAGLSAPQGDDHVAAPTDVVAAPPPFQPATQAILRNRGGGNTPGGYGSTPAWQPVPLPRGTVDTDIGLLVTYSNSFSALWGSELTARTRVSSLVELANSAHANSGTGVRYRVVGWKMLDAADDTPQVQLENLRLDAGAFQGTAALRRQQGAALAVFFAPLNEVTVATNTCGIAYVPAAYASGLIAYRQQLPQLPFAALNDGQWNDQYCESLSLAHELGHLFGAVHDKPNSPFKGVFDFSHGKGVPGVFGTVMSYVTPRVALFSSPQLQCSPDGDACGSNTENVVATVLQTKSTAAALGLPGAPAVSVDTGLQLTGWMVRSDGAPFTGAVALKATDNRVTCLTGSTGFYQCSVPAGVASVTLSATVPGRTVTPAAATFVMNPTSAQANTAGRFHVN